MTEAVRLPLFTAEDFRNRVLSGRHDESAHDLGDHVLNPDLDQLVERAGAETSVILTTRAKTLRQHSGQVAFPGGSIDPADASPEDAALRESFEEIALDPRHVETIGRLPRYLTTTGFRITPVLAIVRPGFTLKPDPAEVADVFEVPLAFLMDAANHMRESRMWQGRERHYYVMPFGDRHIWGVTAGIIRTLYERLYA